MSITWVNRLQHAFNAGKIAGLLAILGFGAYAISLNKFDNLINPFENSSDSPGQYAVAFQVGLYSFSGWSYLNFVVEEIKNPNK